MPIVTVKPMTADELLLLGAPARRGDLWDGRFVPLEPLEGPAGVMLARIGRALDAFVNQHRLGFVTPPGQGFHVRQNPDRVLFACVAFTSIARLPKLGRHFVPFAPDFAVEIVESKARWEDRLVKAGVWIGHGSDAAWVVDPFGRRVAVVRAGDLLAVVEGDGIAKAERPLPGFSIALADLFRDLPGSPP